MAGPRRPSRRGCLHGNPKFLASKQSMAMQTAVARAQFDLNRPSATPTVLSQETVQAQVMGVCGGASGLLRAEYTIGVDGCGRRKTYVVLCRKAEPVALRQALAGS